jgi:hypothetical protein
VRSTVAVGGCRSVLTFGDFAYHANIMTDAQTTWLVIGTLVVVFAIAEMLLGRVLDVGIKPIDRVCRRLPRRVQIALVALLLAAAAGAWVYGCSRPGFR